MNLEYDRNVFSLVAMLSPFGARRTLHNPHAGQERAQLRNENNFAWQKEVWSSKQP